MLGIPRLRRECKNMLTMFVRGLPRSMTQSTLEQLFASHGRVFDAQVTKDLFSDECKASGS